MLQNKTVVLGVSGSIAAYKAAGLASMLVKAGADVRVIMTKNAVNIINPITFESLTGHKCMVDTFDRNFEFKVNHISLAKKASVFVIAPASANVIAKISSGIADDMLTTTFLAASCPKIICPAMNSAMFENQITQDNIEKCRSYGMTIVSPVCGYLAEGMTGIGKMPEPKAIFDYIIQEIGAEKDLSGKRVLVTAGPTQESLDPVRFITNHSSGKMGYAIARAASMRGAETVLISGPVSLEPPPFVQTVGVTSARQMFTAVRERFSEYDIIIKAAAVADYRPLSSSSEKIKKSSGTLSIDCERTDDILQFLGQNKKSGQFICGFSMETENVIENSRSKLQKKNADMIVANSLKEEGAGFSSDTNRVTLITRNSTLALQKMSKADVADRLLDEIIRIMHSEKN
ncbi:MAG: bifunctional phosphopantothenoylcysteine decarboxylase/phosphopantothenate--cysteine ligase CoaBC [Treponema sp.]|nr:bifunctional phosphopantothenoylcysteine decarboxylase/phosphopantothenate--cysteine ligase CoaBC [Treponema sp.]